VLCYVAKVCKPATLPYKSKRTLYGVIGQLLMVECTPDTGTEPYSIRWYRSSNQVNNVPGDVEVFTSGLMKFINYRDNQTGDYRCEVSSNCSGDVVDFDNEVKIETASESLCTVYITFYF